MTQKIVLATYGSSGDVLPFIGIAQELKANGFRPLIATMLEHHDLVTGYGLDFYAVRPSFQDSLAGLGDNPIQALERFQRRDPRHQLNAMLLRHLSDTYDDMMRIIDGSALVVTSSLSFGAKLAAEKRDLPHLGVALQPFTLWSNEDPSIRPEAPAFSKLVFMGGPLFAKLYTTARDFLTRSSETPIHELRQVIGLPRLKINPITRGQFTRHGALALFSKLLGDIQPDHPQNTSVVGFVRVDQSNQNQAFDPALRAFLDSGPPPIVVATSTSALNNSERFVQKCATTIVSLGLRAVLILDGELYKQWSAKSLPNIFVTSNASHASIFPMGRVIIHHGGIGTTAQAMLAGRPQLIVPHNGDQFDNAYRIKRLRIGQSITRRQYSSRHLKSKLNQILRIADYSCKAREISHSIAAENGAKAAAKIIGDMIANPPSPPMVA